MSEHLAARRRRPPACATPSRIRPRDGSPRSRRVLALRDALIRSLVPVASGARRRRRAARCCSATNPFTFYGNIWQYGVQQGSWQDSAMLAAPLLLIAVGLIVVFRANIWNLGYDGQYLLGAALITGVAPHLERRARLARACVVLFALVDGGRRAPGRSSRRSSRRATRPTRSSPR